MSEKDNEYSRETPRKEVYDDRGSKKTTKPNYIPDSKPSSQEDKK